MRAAAERHPGIFVTGFDLFRLEAERVERPWLGPIFGHLMREARRNADIGAGLEAIAAETEILDRAAGDGRHRRHHPQ